MVSACGQVHRAGWIGAARLTCRSPSTASVNSSGEAMAAVARDAARSAEAAPMLKPRLEEEMLSMATIGDSRSDCKPTALLWRVELYM